MLSDYDYRWALHLPDLTVGVPTQAPLPPLVEPASQPLVTHPVAEPLIDIGHRSVRTLSPYWHAGWASAHRNTLVRAGAADRLHAAAEGLPAGFGLAVLDAWRPLSLQRDIYEAAYADPSLPPGFVSFPSEDPATPPPHLTGGAVDLTLMWQGHALRLGTDFDDFTDVAHTAALEQEAGLIRELRRLLYWTMHHAGLVVLDCEWWHFEYGTRRWAAVTGRPPIYGPADPDFR